MLKINFQKLDQITAFAKEQGYDGAEYRGRWRGCSCYEPFFGGGKVAVVGLPLMILDEGEWLIRMSTPDEAMLMIGDFEN